MALTPPVTPAGTLKNVEILQRRWLGVTGAGGRVQVMALASPELGRDSACLSFVDREPHQVAVLFKSGPFFDDYFNATPVSG